MVGGSSLATLSERIREDFPATLFFVGRVALDGARTPVTIPLADALTTYRVEAIAWTGSGFVDVATGRTKLDTVLVPVDDQLDCTDALDRIEATLRLFAPDARLRRLHIGTNPPRLPTAGAREFMLRQGPVVQTIISVAHETGAGLIAMPTAGRHGVFDALRGSTTERVLREAGLPILAAPV